MKDSATEGRVMAVFRQVFKNKGIEPPEMGPATALDRSLGLESIDFAEVVVPPRAGVRHGPSPRASHRVSARSATW